MGMVWYLSGLAFSFCVKILIYHFKHSADGFFHNVRRWFSLETEADKNAWGMTLFACILVGGIVIHTDWSGQQYLFWLDGIAKDEFMLFFIAMCFEIWLPFVLNFFVKKRLFCTD